MEGVKLGKAHTTYIGVLLKVLLRSKGDVVELGAGPISTTLLHWVCKDMNRFLISFENNQKFYNLAKQYQSPLHRIRYVTDWDEIDAKTYRGVVFIDHAPPNRRSIEAIRFKDSADYIVIHDTDQEKHYGYQKLWPHFKNIYTWKQSRPWVSVVSNFKDLSKLEGNLT